MKNSERILLEFKDDEQKGFRLLYDSFYDSLVLFDTQVIGEAEEAADIVQECFVDFWVNRRFSSLRGSLEHYLFSAVKHGCLNYLRNTRRREDKHEQIREELYSETPGEDSELIEKLYLAIETLPEERKRILHMVCIEGMKYQEVADRLGVSINTVKTQMGRSFQFLRKELKMNDELILVLFFKKKLFPAVTRNE